MSTATGPTIPTTPTTTEPSRTSRRWAVPVAFVGGAAAVALLGAAALASGAEAPVTAMQMVRGEQHGHGPADAARMQHRAEVDPELRGQHIAELAQRLGVDAEELTATLEAFRADRADMREELAGLEPAERREAMRTLAEARRTALAEILGVDVDVLAELHGEAGHGQGGPQAGRMGGRMGPHARG
jgi:hypothetical protein